MAEHNLPRYVDRDGRRFFLLPEYWSGGVVRTDVFARKYVPTPGGWVGVS